MAKIFQCFIFICLIACVVSQMFMFPKVNYDSPRETLIDIDFGFKVKSFNSFIETLKNPVGPHVNPNNQCVWKICSKPLEGRDKTPSYKDITAYTELDNDQSDLIQKSILDFNKNQ